MDDKEFLADLAEVPVTHTLDGNISCECITDCYYMIAVLRDGKIIVGFRLYDMHYNYAADYSYSSVEQRVHEKTVNIANMAWLSDANGSRLACTQGVYDDYTQLSPTGEPLSYYRPLVCVGAYGNLLLVDYKGGIIHENIAPTGQELPCSCVGVANLVFEQSDGRAKVDKLPRCKPMEHSYHSVDSRSPNLKYYQLYSEDIYSSDQSRTDGDTRRTFAIKTLVYKEQDKVFKEGSVAISTRGISDYYGSNRSMLKSYSEPLFLSTTGDMVDASGEPIEGMPPSRSARIISCYPTFAADISTKLIMKALPLAVLQDYTSWENFASLTQLDEDCQCTYMPAEDMYKANHSRPVGIGDTDVAVIPRGLSGITCVKTATPAGAPPLSMLITGTSADVEMQNDFDWVLNFKSTSAHAAFRLYLGKRTKSVKEVHISGALEVLQNYALRGLNGLKEIELPDSMYMLGMHCCEDCSSLEKIKFPSNLRGIGASSFCRCAQLQSIELPEGLLAIGANAFAGCISLKTLVIPESVRVIHRKAFADCSGITNLIIKGNPKIEVTAFNGCNPAVSAAASEYESFNELKETAKKLKVS